MIHILNKGVQAIEEKWFLKQMFCSHQDTITGEDCAPNGMVRLNGSTELTVCKDCGKVLKRIDTMY